ncbi:colanic acid biosynthesis glycosyl transferase WcaI [Sphaerotilus hippei]|uniref:Colanic acid biosynthesis glycosyl transferase WcaI n=1 Tax=Sphaerotilus hippei TaxID=744406 RepID=A0A318GWE1_9BURK|nr:glycosyltransferase WbuB [Sphaerotilus hippei]PXW93252.1 colanic acid biosynthesis glycosyl transferase WcaI [Sphaerotilus hippei]
MKILVHGINFHPEPTGIGKYSGEMCERLAAMGHEVRVVTAPPYYPGWKITEGWTNGYTRSRWRGVDVWRAPLWVPARPSGLKRVLHLLSFSVAALPLLARQLLWRPDVVMVVAPAVVCAPWAWLTARLSGARAWLHVQDFEVDAAYQLGLLNSGGLRRKLVTGIERWLLQRFDRLSTISHRMLDRARDKGVAEERLVYLPNWVDDQAITRLTHRSSYRDELGLSDDTVVALFSGTMGGKQGLELLPEVARQLAATHPQLMLVLCGSGVVKPQLEAQCQGLTNVRMLPLQPAERLNELLGMADIHLLPQHPGAADLVMPSKLSGMLASGRPVVTTSHPGTELERVVGRCGRVVSPGDADAFAQALRELADDAPRRDELGTAARHYAEQHLAQSSVLKRLEVCLLACANHSTSGVELPMDHQHTGGV